MRRNSIFLAGLAAMLGGAYPEVPGIPSPVSRADRRGNTLGTTDAYGVEYAMTQNGGIRRFSERVSKLPRKVRKAIWRKSAI